VAGEVIGAGDVLDAQAFEEAIGDADDYRPLS